VDAPHKQSLRIVIQRIGSGREASFRVVAYGGSGPLGHSDFSSAQSLLKTLNTAVPDFPGAADLLSEFRDSENPIVFSGEMLLDYSQLAVLGLNRGHTRSGEAS
jgi:hypothetical protein